MFFIWDLNWQMGIDTTLENIEPFVLAQTDLEKQVAMVADPIIAAHGCTLVRIKVVPQKSSLKVILYVDGALANHSITLDQLEFLNRHIGDALDVADNENRLFKTSYELEVSSPGLDRPLAKKSHFDAVLGKRIRLKTDGLGQPKSLTGILIAVEIESIRLQSAIDGALLEIPWSRIKDAHLVYEFPQKNVGKNLRKVP